jgi:hypothetical protein
LASKLFNAAKAIDDFIIDRALQPIINRALWIFNIPSFTVARVSTVIGAGVGVIWIHRFDAFLSADFYQDTLCLAIMVAAAFIQIAVHERQAPRRANMMPAVRATGLLWRTAWICDLGVFPFQWPVQGHRELAFNFAWTALVVLPYWIICCSPPPPRLRRRVVELSPVTVPAR